MIKPFIKDSAFFQSLRDRNMSIAYKDLDNSFNKIASYINDKLIPFVDNLAIGAVGVLGEDDLYLRNRGDGTTFFDTIRSGDIADYSLPLNKIERVTASSVLISDSNTDLRSMESNLDHTVLLYKDGNLSWDDIFSNNFDDNSIDGGKVGIGTLTKEHLSLDFFLNSLAEQNVQTQHIQDSTITTDKIDKGSFTSAKISPGLLATRWTDLNYITFKENCFSNRTIPDGSIPKAWLDKWINKSYTGVPYYDPRSSIFTQGNISTYGNPSSYNRITLDTSTVKIKPLFDIYSTQTISGGSEFYQPLNIATLMAQTGLTLSDNAYNEPNPTYGYVKVSRKIGKDRLAPGIRRVLEQHGGLAP